MSNVLKEKNAGKVWNNHALYWQAIGVPLKPSLADTQLMLATVSPALSDQDKVLVFGVTPEIIQLPWPEYIALQSVDCNRSMINRVWQPNLSVASSAIVAHWQNLPLDDGAAKVIVGDGVFTALPSISVYPEVASEMHRVLGKHGMACIRCFIRPDTQEPLQQIFNDAMAGSIVSFHSLKWRLAMFLAGNEEVNAIVSLSDVLSLFDSLFPERLELARVNGWHIETVNTIDAYGNNDCEYTFPSLKELELILSQFFRLTIIGSDTYELAERCPIICLEPLSSE